MTDSFLLFDYLNLFWFGVLPYVALAIFFLVTIQRYTNRAYTYSSLSSQFLENKAHFWALVPFHYGVLTILAGHVIGFLLPKQVLWWNSVPLRLYILEVTAFIGGIFTLVGLVNIVIRRMTDAKAKMVTSTADWIVISILIVQVGTGLYTAIFHNWGSSWFAASLAPYLWSIVKFSPEIAYVTPMPLMVKLHIIGAFAIILLFPFTRLVHILVVPNPYLWRKPQMVRWYWDRKTIRTPEFKIENK
ncbi:MAG: respiratory nitrate reductase subunit gamma, partial [bacterium]